MSKLRKSALIISPFATAPLDAGQRLRAHQTSRMIQNLGYEVTFFLYAFEDAWYWKSQHELLCAMREQWQSVRIIYSKRQVSRPPMSGDLHQLDEWWDESLGAALSGLMEYESYEICVVHNVWLSKALDYVPERTIKIIDTHDLFSARRKVFKQAGLDPEFFVVDWEAEKFGLSRAHLVLTIKSQEADAMEAGGLSRPIINIPYQSGISISKIAENNYIGPDKVRFGFLGSAHPFNRVGLRQLLDSLNVEVKRTLAPVELIVAGTASRFCEDKGAGFRATTLGYVESEEEFYKSVDIAIVPVFEGTGFKVKVAELLNIGKPILCSDHAAEGVSLDRDQTFSSPALMAQRMTEIALHRPSLTEMTRQTMRASVKLRDDYDRACGLLCRAIQTCRRVQVFLLTVRSLTARAFCFLMSAILQARNLIRTVETYIVIPQELGIRCHDLNKVSAPGLLFFSVEEFDRHFDEIVPPNAFHCGPGSSGGCAGRDVCGGSCDDRRRAL